MLITYSTDQQIFKFKVNSGTKKEIWVNHDTQSSEYISIYEDELYIALITPDEILHTLQNKYKINIYIQDKYQHDLGGRDICQLKNYLEKLYENVNILFNDNLPTEYIFHSKSSSY